MTESLLSEAEARALFPMGTMVLDMGWYALLPPVLVGLVLFGALYLYTHLR
ncbi:hypothetical protein [Pacificispira sp.]|uniref:hypothetical protein n=1 Tax=Pacificispira sp. TaxID=2888761 RepID=UPI003BAB69C0